MKKAVVVKPFRSPLMKSVPKKQTEEKRVTETSISPEEIKLKEEIYKRYGERIESLKTRFHVKEFRPGQEEAIVHLLNKQDVFALLPTGAGKTMCYQIPSHVLEGTTVVVSPLIALMEDQVANMKSRGIEAVYYNSTLGAAERTEIKTRLAGIGTEIKVLFLAPELIATEGGQQMIVDLYKRRKLSFFAIDEAHCISSWGHDFRPSYLKLAVLRKLCPDVNIIALTATATKAFVPILCYYERPSFFFVSSQCPRRHSQES